MYKITAYQRRSKTRVTRKKLIALLNEALSGAVFEGEWGDVVLRWAFSEDEWKLFII